MKFTINCNNYETHICPIYEIYSLIMTGVYDSCTIKHIHI